MSDDELRLKWIGMRAPETLVRKLRAICKATGRTKTAVISDLINAEYEKNETYRDFYYADLEKGV